MTEKEQLRKKTSKCTCPLLNTSINNKQINGLSVTVTE